MKFTRILLFLFGFAWMINAVALGYLSYRLWDVGFICRPETDEETTARLKMLWTNDVFLRD